jgi:hypothetical protein
MYFDMANATFRVAQNNFCELLSLTLPPDDKIKDASYLGNKARWKTQTHHAAPHGGTFRVRDVDLRPSHEKYSKILRQSLLWRSVLEEVNYHLQVMIKDGFENGISEVGAKHLNGSDVWTGDAHEFQIVEAMYTPHDANLYASPSIIRYAKDVDRMPPFHDTFQMQLQTELVPVLEMYRAAARRTRDQINENTTHFLLEYKNLKATEQTKPDATTTIPDTQDALLKLHARIENLLQFFLE